MIDVITELDATREFLRKRSLGINFVLRQERERLVGLGIVPNALEGQPVKTYDIPEITAYWLLGQIAGADTTKDIPVLLAEHDEWNKTAERVLAQKEKN